MGGWAALDEMGRAVERLLTAVADPPAVARPVVPDGWRELPDFDALEAALAVAEAGWADWRRRLAAVAL